MENKKLFIHSDSDLPQETGKYEVCLKNGQTYIAGFRVDDTSGHSPDAEFWLNEITWWRALPEPINEKMNISITCDQMDCVHNAGHNINNEHPNHRCEHPSGVVISTDGVYQHCSSKTLK